MPISHKSTPKPQEFAAIDLGSNSFHMVIARVVDGAMQVLGRLKQRVHLADGWMPGTTSARKRWSGG